MPLIQPRLEPTPASINLKGKTAIVTGASAGIGLETCRQLLQLNLTNLYMAVRNVPKGEDVKKMLLNDPAIQSHNSEPNVKVVKLDMDDSASVQNFSRTVKAEIPVIDILILNAGTGNVKFEESASGHERVLQVNYLSNALLVLLLLPLLIRSAEKTGSPTRLTWVGSRMHRRSTFINRPVAAETPIIEWMDDPQNFSTFNQYSDTKLLALFFMMDVAQRVSRDKVVFNMMCPGMVYTDMANHLPWLVRNLTHLVWSIRGRSPEQGAWTVVNAAVVAGEESHGRFLDDKTISE
ncbi:hypothetical protein MMC10_010720 [Thelotrema lepadinum]|nr:hypothetical protein [Thelotrema lepadinum]